ncbi:MAG TPA: G1 family glutamic endopeptidase [Conexibacter sp.]|jgi:hypothetical protein
MRKRAPLALFVTGAALCGICASASAATTDDVATSANWAGYAASVASTDATASDPQFSRVSASWTQPAADCSSGAGDAAFWVGLGGAGEQSQALEQAGTEASCDGAGNATYSAWYELVPAAPVTLDLTINPGDRISSYVTIDGTQVKVSLTDQTSGKSATKTLAMDSPDTSSAEWIAEAPSQCDAGLNSCQPVPLANFGSVSFTDVSATAAGHTGTLTDPAWTAQPMQLASEAAAGAAPTTASDAGDAFDVSVTPQATADGSDPGGWSDGSGGNFGGGWDDGSQGWSDGSQGWDGSSQGWSDGSQGWDDGSHGRDGDSAPSYGWDGGGDTGAIPFGLQ